MPSTNKTENYELNSWISTDKPMMSDFNMDNSIIDSVLSGHILDSDIHISSEIKSKIDNPFKVGIWAGTGTESCIRELDFSPRIILVGMVGVPLIKYNSSGMYNVINSAIGLNNSLGCTAGVELNGNNATLYQTQSAQEGTDFINLNKSGGIYLYIAFK